MSASGSHVDVGVGMSDVLKALEAIQESQHKLATEVESVSQRLDVIAPITQDPTSYTIGKISALNTATTVAAGLSRTDRERSASASESIADPSSPTTNAAAQAQKSGFTSRIILT